MLEVALADLPRRISAFDAVEQCYQEQLRFAVARLNEDVSVLIRCEKQIIPYLLRASPKIISVAAQFLQISTTGNPAICRP